MHEDNGATERGAGGGHGWVPGEAADVIDDFSPGTDGVVGCLSLVGVNGDAGSWACLEDCFYDGEDAVLLGSGRFRLVFAGAGGFATDVEDVGTLVEELEGVGDGELRLEVKATVRK